MGAKSAYLNGELKEEIFMGAPPGFEVLIGMALRLIKAAYGTKQSWYEGIRGKVSFMGHQRTEADYAVTASTALYADVITMA